MGTIRRKRKSTYNLEQSNTVTWHFFPTDFKALFKGSSYYCSLYTQAKLSPEIQILTRSHVAIA